MVVIVLEKCPLSLRGDITKWLQEISLGVYVGQVSARVRDNLWERICSEAKTGRATMVFSARNEQHLDFRVHNTTWEPIDFDGLKLMLHPSAARLKALGARRIKTGGASKKTTTKKRRSNLRPMGLEEYVVLDVETTGLDCNVDEIIEIGVLKMGNGEEQDTFHAMIKTSSKLSEEVTNLTGLTDDDLIRGRDIAEVIDQLLYFIGSMPIVMHNARFDMAFIDSVLERLDIDELDNECIDTLALAKKRLPHATSYRLEELTRSLGIETNGLHRAMGDCRATKDLFEYLTDVNLGSLD